MTGRPVRAARARRTLLLLSATRWFPTGLIIGLTTLVMVERGLSLSEIGLVVSVQGLLVLGLELPTGGFADALGRRPVLIAAACFGVASAVVFLVAHTLAAFVLAAALQGAYRALDSGPLEAWYVDTAQAADPDARVEGALAQAGTVLGVAIAAGALLSGVIVAWHPVAMVDPLVPPLVVAVVGQVAHVLLVAVLVREPRASSRRRGRVWRSVVATPAVVIDGLRTLGRAPVLRALVLVEVFWSVGMIGFEILLPVRLAQLVGGEQRAGALIGPVSAVAWALFALGASLAGLTSRRLGVGWTALFARVLNGMFVVLMGLAQGPVGLVVAFLLTYTVHGAAGPMHATLLHRQADRGDRATVLSMNSMVAGGTFSLAVLALGPLAQHTSTATAMIVAGGFSILGAALYLPAIRADPRTVVG